MGSSELIYGADELPLMLDQSVFSITMRNTVRMADVGSVVVVGGRVVVVVVVVVGGRVVVVVEVVVGGRVVVVVVVGRVGVVVAVVVGGRGVAAVVGGGAARGSGGRRGGRRAPGQGRGGRRRRWRRDRQAERPLRPAVPVDDDEVRLPRRHRRREAGGAIQTGRIGAGVVVATPRDLGPARAGAAPQVEHGVEGRAGAAGLDGRRARDRRRPLEDLLGGSARATAAAAQRARAAGRAAEGPSLGGEDGRAAAAPGERGHEGLALAGRNTLTLAASEHAPPAGPRVASGADARGDLVAARLPTLPRDGGSVRGVGEVQRREQREQ